MTAPRLILGDCVEAMREMEEGSIDAGVTDPPYGLEFMGKEWDRLAVDASHRHARPERSGYGLPRFGSYMPFAGEDAVEALREHRNQMQAWHYAWAVEALRVLKPGGHLVAFGGTRTYHRLACALEDAGFEIRDCLAWMYGSGFPKSLDVSKALDRSAGVEREDKFGGAIDRRIGPTGNRRCEECGKWLVSGSPCRCPRPQDAAVSTEGQLWQGWGTALKPAHEPVVLARRPLVGTVAANVLAHGTGAVNVDGCRVEAEGGSPAAQRRAGSAAHLAPGSYEKEAEGRITSRTSLERYAEQRPGELLGRWPANVLLGHHEDCAELDCHPDCPVRLLDEQSGERRSPGDYARAIEVESELYGSGMGRSERHRGHGDTGGASRFFYTAKASRAERNAGLEGFEERIAADRHAYTGLPDQRMDHEQARYGARNHHPTVKPIALMRWLARLVTPPGGTVLDPFLGSGTTGIAAALEGFSFVGVERDPEYLPIAEARIAFWREHGEGALALVAEREAGERRRAEVSEAGQLDIFEGAA